MEYLYRMRLYFLFLLLIASTSIFVTSKMIRIWFEGTVPVTEPQVKPTFTLICSFLIDWYFKQTNFNFILTKIWAQFGTGIFWKSFTWNISVGWNISVVAVIQLEAINVELLHQMAIIIVIVHLKAVRPQEMWLGLTWLTPQQQQQKYKMTVVLLVFNRWF